MPQEWGTAIICPIYKQGDKLECHKYHGISLLNVTYKLFTNLLTRYIDPYVEEILEDYQCGFRKGRSTIGRMYIDYKQEHDTINRVELVE